jgi:hypothetical protein
MVVEQARDMIGKSARIVGRQQRLVKKLKAEGADTTEAEHLLAYFVAAHLMFENCLQKAIREQDEAAAREAQNLAAS